MYIKTIRVQLPNNKLTNIELHYEPFITLSELKDIAWDNSKYFKPAMSNGKRFIPKQREYTKETDNANAYIINSEAVIKLSGTVLSLIFYNLKDMDNYSLIIPDYSSGETEEMGLKEFVSLILMSSKMYIRNRTGEMVYSTPLDNGLLHITKEPKHNYLTIEITNLMMPI